MTTDLPYFTLDKKTQDAITAYKNGNTDQPMAFVNGRDISNKPFKLSYEFEALGDIMVGEYGHSILVRFTDPNDHEEFQKIEELASSTLPDGITFKESLREDKMFIKLQTKDDKYKATFNPPINPTSLDKSTIHQGALLDITFQPNMWINFNNQAGGIFLNIAQITIDGGKKKPIRRR